MARTYMTDPNMASGAGAESVASDNHRTVTLAKDPVIIAAPPVSLAAWQARQMRTPRATAGRLPVMLAVRRLRAGLRIGRWTLVGQSPIARKEGRCECHPACWAAVTIARTTNLAGVRWACRCDCGNERAVSLTSLITGGSLSCGCFAADRTRYTHEQRRLALESERAARALVGEYANDELNGNTL